ncbi:Transposase [Lyngbya sp. PCC 8106]|nr:Transposase [Lyngbya sp. PCC 8106]
MLNVPVLSVYSLQSPVKTVYSFLDNSFLLTSRASAFKFKEGQIYLAKSKEPLPIRWSRQFPTGCTPSTITVKLDPSGRWFVSLKINDPIDHKLKPVDKKVGIDLGISSLFTTSDGVKVSNPRHFNKLYKKLRLAQKSLNRKIKGSKNREKARVKVARIQAKIWERVVRHI